MHMIQVNDVWQKPQAAPFSGHPESRDASPLLSPDGNILLFYSKRQKSGKLEPEDNYDIWISYKRQNGTWTHGMNMGDEVH